MKKHNIKKKKVIIIGAGLAGMSAGYYLQVNGFDTEIFEMHSASGGLCTSWERKGYMIDGCIHFMSGTAPGDTAYRFWNDLIDMQSIRFIYSDTHAVIENHKRERVHLYSNVDELEKELLRISPEDKKHISTFIRTIRKFIGITMPFEKPVESMSLIEKFRVGGQMLPHLPAVLKLMKISSGDFAKKFKNSELRRAFEIAFVSDSPLLYTVMPFVWRHKKETGYPEGGAIRISGSIEKRYKEVGGIIHFNAEVARVLEKDNKVFGIELANGEKHVADIVISAADGYSTIYKFLGGRFKDKKVTDRYESKVFQTIDKTLYVSLGLNKDFSSEPPKLYFPLTKPIIIDPMTTLDFLEISHYCDDLTASPEGRSLLTLMPDAKDWEYWENLRKNNKMKYDLEKERIAGEVIEALDARFGNIKENVEMIDVVTPATYIRYTNNWTGGQISWKGTRKTFGKPTAWQIDGLKDFYMTGQWAGVAGGLSTVVMMGNHLTQIICKKEGIKFGKNDHHHAW